jgi:hypothetical protein
MRERDRLHKKAYRATGLGREQRKRENQRTRDRLGWTELLSTLLVDDVVEVGTGPCPSLASFPSPARQRRPAALLREPQHERERDVIDGPHLAALAIEHGATLCTTDRDFARFEGLRWKNPIAPARVSERKRRYGR